MRRRVSWLVIVAAVAVVLAVPGRAAAATSTLDQANDVAAQGHVGIVEPQVQTFTAGRDGALDRVEVKGFQAGTPGQVTFGILAVDSTGLPTGSLLGSGTADTTTLPLYAGDENAGGWLSVPISPAVQVQAGTRYALSKVANLNIRIGWSVSVGDTYTSGSGTYNDFAQPYDYLFRTYVLSPDTGLPSCLGETATIYVEDGVIVGGPGDGKPYQGTLTGTTGDDVIVGTDVADTIRGGNGDDLICGLAGNDVLSGDNGNDHVDGGAGNDRVRGNNGDDVLTGGSGADTIDGGRGADVATDYTFGQGDIVLSIP